MITIYERTTTLKLLNLIILAIREVLLCFFLNGEGEGALVILALFWRPESIREAARIDVTSRCLDSKLDLLINRYTNNSRHRDIVAEIDRRLSASRLECFLCY